MEPASPASALLPGYGWIFGLGDGTVNVGLGMLNSVQGVRQDRLPRAAARLAGRHARGVGAARGERDGPIGGAGLPMGFNRTPHYAGGLLLVGDAGGVVNPFNGEGIAYAMESGALAAEIACQALARPAGPSRAGAARYPTDVKDALRRLLPARRDLLEADRQPAGDEDRDPARPAAPT